MVFDSELRTTFCAVYKMFRPTPVPIRRVVLPQTKVSNQTREIPVHPDAFLVIQTMIA